MCNGQAVWEVINQHEDFENISPLNKDAPPETIFHILRQEHAKYTMVLDTSGSMGQNSVRGRDVIRRRIERMIEAATNFVEFSVEDGSMLGVVDFRYFRIFHPSCRFCLFIVKLLEFLTSFYSKKTLFTISFITLVKMLQLIMS